MPPRLPAPLTFDPSYISRAWELIAQDGAPREVRIIGTERDGTVSGIFDNPDHPAEAIAKWDGVCSIYMTVNPLKVEMLSRANVGRLVSWTKTTTTDGDITARAWLIVDVDPVTPVRDIPATDAERDTALEVRNHIAAWLTKTHSFPLPASGQSGNGGRLLYRVDLPNTQESTDLVRRCLQALDRHFTVKGHVEIDTGVFNASRIDKVWGTVAVKGAASAERPHRRAFLDDVPKVLEVVTREQLMQLAGPVADPPTRGLAKTTGAGEDFPRLIETLKGKGHYLKQAGAKHLIRCPWQDLHSTTSGPTETALYEPSPDNGGAGGFKCQHLHCVDRTIGEVYRLFIEPAAPRQSRQSTNSESLHPEARHTSEPKRSRAVWVPDVIKRYIDDTQSDQSGRLLFNVPAFDACLRGLGRGDVLVVVGSLGVGKTGFLVNLLERITTPKRVPALLASLEMADTQLVERMASFTLLKPGREIEDLVARRDPWVVHALARDAAAAWQHVRIIDAALTIGALDEEIALAAAESPLRVVAVDYLGLLAPGRQSAYQEVSQIARETKTLAKKHGVSILMLVQTSRAATAGTPVTINMARDSGAIGESVDFAFGLWRPALAEQATPEERVRWDRYLIARCLKARASEHGQVFRMDWRPETWHIGNAIRLDPETLEEMPQG